MTREEFEELVAEALDRIPPELTRLMDNVAVFVEDEPPADDPELLGLYEGTPLTDRGEWYAGVLPDRITIYRNPTLRMCETREDVVAETEVTVVHEFAHHFGIAAARLLAVGFGGGCRGGARVSSCGRRELGRGTPPSAPLGGGRRARLVRTCPSGRHGPGRRGDSRLYERRG
jgi:predicted Zn-dependent protease with MMP-like domain